MAHEHDGNMVNEFEADSHNEKELAALRDVLKWAQMTAEAEKVDQPALMKATVKQLRETLRKHGLDLQAALAIGWGFGCMGVAAEAFIQAYI